MGYEQTNVGQKSRLNEFVKQCQPLDSSQAELIDEWASGDRPLVEAAIELVRTLSPEILDRMPTQLASNILGNILLHMMETLGNIQTFDPKKVPGEPSKFLVDKIRLLDTQYQQLTEALGPMISLHTYRNRDADLRESKEEAASLVKRIETIKSDAETTLEAIKKAAAEVGVSKHSVVFFEEAQVYRRTSVGWFFGIMTLVIVGVYVVWRLFVEHPLTGGSLSAILSSAGIKLFVVATFFVLLSLLVKNYSAARHNSVINKHRALALQTFETFTEAAKGDTKDAILRAVTDAIFSVQKTGYIAKEAAPSGLSNVTELIHRASNTKIE